jgi:GAF domain-containing protein
MQEIKIDTNYSKEEKYKLLLSQLDTLINVQDNYVSSISNVISALHNTMIFFWTGLYFVTKNELQLGIFQGTVACTNIAFGKGVCGTCYQKKEVIIVEDVNLFEGHIACSSLSQSEIVLPVFDDDKNIIAVFDVDSEHLAYFDKVDQIYLEKALKLIAPFINQFLKSNYQ